MGPCSKGGLINISMGPYSRMTLFSGDPIQGYDIVTAFILDGEINLHQK